MSKLDIDFTAPAKPCVCVICKECFTSKTKLFKHLEVHGYEGPNTKPERVVLLIGWLSDYCKDSDEWDADLSGTSINKDASLDKVENSLYRAIYALENNLGSVADIDPSVLFERPRGSSRASSVVQRSAMLLGVEPSCHCLCDTICLNMKHYTNGSNEDWVGQVNRLLPSSVRVLQKYVLSAEMSPNELHAEVSCTQYRYEYMLPLRLLMPPNSAPPRNHQHDDDDGAGAGQEGEEAEQGGEEGSISTWLNQAVVRRKVYHPSGKNTISKGIYSMDQQFPFETAEGQARVAFFRNLKRISKVVAGRKSFHNFASGGASPEDTVSVRKIDRIYHKELVSIEGEPWVVFSVSGDAFLRGQVRRILGVTVAMARGLLPENYFDLAAEKGTICEVPALPGWGLYLAECKYAYYEAKFEDLRLDPRRVVGADSSRIDAWKTEIHTHIAQISRTVGDSWLAEFDESCRGIFARQQTMRELMNRPRPVLEALYESTFGRKVPVTKANSATNVAHQATAISTDEVNLSTAPCVIEKSPAETEIQFHNALKCHSDPAVSAAYAKVLRLLQEADASGLWPANSTGRQKVIVNAPVAAVEGSDSQSDLVPPGVEADEIAPESTECGGVAVEIVVGEDSAGVTEKSGMSEDGDKPAAVSAKAPRKNRNHKLNKATSKAKKQRPDRTTMEPTEAEDLLQDSPATGATEGGASGEGEKQTVGDSEGDRDANREAGSASPVRTRGGVHRPPLQPAHRRRDADLVSDSGVGGSFSVGCLPKHLAQPKGNQLFPELMKACFDLERILCPHRPPSSTIAINRHAQFSPHRDSGAGSGQSQSLIVALGDFAGGEIAVESVTHDIRYKPLEFNGWMQRHWTLPFVGQRFSLVWFTPLGITEEDLWWWKE